MQTKGKFFDDVAKVAGGAMGTLGGMKQEAEAAVRQRVERLLSDMDLVPRDEFDAMAAVARRAREEQEKLAVQVTDLEARLAKLEKASGTKQAAPAKKARVKKTTVKAKATKSSPKAAS
ncbi:MAG: accessory factor UbiK family protein [Alphaproteobacteria bacterium]|nr:accessory factor UbiK family protein [Alphaproteobacteria bacterium]